MLTRTACRLRQHLQELQYTSQPVPGGAHKLYKLATRMGGVLGCKLLLEEGLSYIPHVVEDTLANVPISEPLLFDAIESRNPLIVLF